MSDCGGCTECLNHVCQAATNCLHCMHADQPVILDVDPQSQTMHDVTVEPQRNARPKCIHGLLLACGWLIASFTDAPT
jgi:hypothetical protein